MQPRRLHAKRKQEAVIQSAWIDWLKLRDWFVKETHGNLYQWGFPDLYATHTDHGPRWIEIKNPVQWSFTKAQLDDFPKFLANGTRIWVLFDCCEEEYRKLFLPCNADEILTRYRMRRL